MLPRPPKEALIHQKNFKLTLFLGVAFCIIGTLMVSNSHPDKCKEYKIRYCDFEDDDIDICYSRGNIYCCHENNYDHHWNRRYE